MKYIFLFYLQQGISFFLYFHFVVCLFRRSDIYIFIFTSIISSFYFFPCINNFKNLRKIQIFVLTLSLLSALFLSKNEQFILENASNLTLEFFCYKKNLYVKLDAYSRRNSLIFSSKTRR